MQMKGVICVGAQVLWLPGRTEKPFMKTLLQTLAEYDKQHVPEEVAKILSAQLNHQSKQDFSLALSLPPPLFVFLMSSLSLSLSVSHPPVPSALSAVSHCPVRFSLRGAGRGKMTMLLYVNAQIHVHVHDGGSLSQPGDLMAERGPSIQGLPYEFLNIEPEQSQCSQKRWMFSADLSTNALWENPSVLFSTEEIDWFTTNLFKESHQGSMKTDYL